MNKKVIIINIFLLMFFSLISIFIGAYGNSYEMIFISRLPRLLSALIAGFGMSISGLIMQQICRNKFVSPTTAATLSSTSLGVLISTIIFNTGGLVYKTIFSFSVALVFTLLFIYFIQKLNIKDKNIVPLIGIMFNYIISAMSTYIAFKFEMNQFLTSFMTGHFSNILKGRYEIMYISLPFIFLAYIYSNYFNIAGLGENTSKSLGLSYKKIVFLGLSICCMVTASIVVICGSISYVGLIIPNLVSIYFGDKLKFNFFITGFMGSLFVLICDIVARVIKYPYELPVDLITGIVGSIIFVILILKKRTA